MYGITLHTDCPSNFIS
jgi:Essential protein Yae1, N terminal